VPWIELIGYVGSVFVVLSLTMSSVVRLRYINLVGSSSFTLYGLLTGTYPVAVTNGCIVLINLWHLSRLRRREEVFSLLEIKHADNTYLRRFLSFHRDDIEDFFPGFALDAVPGARICLVLRDVNPAGLVIWTEEGDTVRIHLDYVLSPYRDLRCARFFMERHEDFWVKQGRRRLLSPAAGQTHRDYLRRLGFKPARSLPSEWYERELTSG